jgi:predicted phage terminase large subunit-like protein
MKSTSAITDFNVEREILAAQLRGSYLEFCKYFFKLITSRDFIVSMPIGRESHHIELARLFTKIVRQENDRRGIMINIPPGFGKSVMVSMLIAWSYTHYPDCNWIYTSYSQELAAKHTAFIKTVMSSQYYQYLFNVELKKDSKAKDNFQTTAGGGVRAFGTGGAITGQDAGLPNLDRFSGGIVIDDPIKPDEVHSETIRSTVLNNYIETIRQRARGFNVPTIFIGQRLHEDDLAAFLLSGEDTIEWTPYILQGLDIAGNALYPEVKPKEELLLLQEKSPYVFASQFQQDPIPAGGALFKPEHFEIMDEEPTFKETFITADTAETDKDYNDATVFSFWGIYEIETMGRKTGMYGLHWIDCQELRVEPKDLEGSFLDFWQDCMHHKNQPTIAAIEKKSTGVTLLSVLQGIRGISVRNVDRTRASGSKTKRFLELQPIIANRQISFSKGARHIEMCLEHMRKITANDTHRHDDICDTLYDAAKLALIDKTLYSVDKKEDRYKDVTQRFADKYQTRKIAGARANARSR